MIFGAGARLRRRLYGAGWLRAGRLPRPVLSVGNLTMGGAGKTPHVMHLAKWLQETGRRVAVLSRGYGRKSRGVVWVSDGRNVTADARAAGDEAALIARALPGVAVVVGESRTQAGREALARVAIDVFVLDDGFQHLPLYRDFDLLLVDCERALGNRWSVPAGPLREPASHARFADGLVVTKCAELAAGERIARAVPLAEGRPRAYSRFVARGIVGRDGRPCDAIRAGSDVFAFSGLARNGQFRDTLEAAGYRVRRFRAFPDHRAYDRGDLARIARDAAGLPVVTTEKDLVRLPAGFPLAVGALKIDVEFLAGWEALSLAMLARLERRGEP
jgi:tetraacyldisaccharide 4'-kinase